MFTTNINDIKKNQVIQLEMKNGKSIIVQFKGVSRLVDSQGMMTSSKVANFARVEMDATKPEPTEFEMFAINLNQIKEMHVSDLINDKANKVMWQRALNSTADLFNKADWSKVVWDEEKLNELQTAHREKVLGNK
jgi:hypothetical protein